MIYRPYEGFLSQARKEFDQQGQRVHRNQLPDFFQEAIQSYHNLRPINNGVINQDMLLILLEQIHYLTSNQVLYISTSLAQRLMETDLSLHLENLHIPFPIFEVCLADNLILDGKPLPSCLAILRPGKLIGEIMERNIKDATNITAKMGGQLEDYASLRFRSPEGGICHCALPIALNQGKNIDVIIEELGSFRDTHLITPLSEKDKEINKKLLRIVLGAICYLNTEKPDVQDYKDRNRPSFSPLPPHGLLIGGSLKSTLTWHLRRGHWRFLRHPKFKRAEDGYPRCVWVRNTEVNKEEEPSIPDKHVTEIS